MQTVVFGSPGKSGGEGAVGLVVFADFHGANTLTMADFKLPV